MKKRKALLIILFGLALAIPLGAVETGFWQIGSFEDFLQGTLLGVSLSKEGELRLAPEVRAIFGPDEALALSLAGDSSHNLYLGTGHQGKVFKVDPQGKGTQFFKAAEPDIFALAAGPDGALYVGSSPDGKIYRVTADGKSKVFFDPKAKYIWALTFDKQGRLYAGTGDQGKIFRVDASGEGKLFFDAKQTHIMCLTLDRDGNLLAGTASDGLIYRLTPEGKPFVLYQSNLPEIHALALDSEGTIYAAALGAAAGQGTPGLLSPLGPQGQTPTTITTVTVEASAGEEGESGESTGKAQTPPAESSGSSPSFNRSAPPSFGLPAPKMPSGRGAIIEINPDLTAETIWNSTNESVFGLAVRGNQVLFSTDANGRIFNLTASRPSQALTLVAETREALATRLLLEGNDLYVATTSVARLFRLSATPGREGSFESPVKDTKFVSHWGVLAWRADTPAGTSIDFFTRSGNTDRPDNTWSDWSGAYHDANGSRITSPAARYIQWKAALHGSGSATPVLDDVTVAFLNQNLPPQIRSLNVSPGGERTSPTGSSSIPGSFPVITVSPGSSPGFGPPAPSPAASPKLPVTLSWQADDPNNDTLVYSLYLKATDESEWHLLKTRIRQTNYTLEADTLPDGKYVAKLVASDEESNPPGVARQAELVSAAFWIDNTPPEVRVLKQEVAGGEVSVQFEAEDHTSPLRGAEFSIDGKEWRSLYSDDGVTDSRRETFTVKARALAPGEHVIALRAYDTAGNAGIGKAVVQVPGQPGSAGQTGPGD